MGRVFKKLVRPVTKTITIGRSKGSKPQPEIRPVRKRTRKNRK